MAEVAAVRSTVHVEVPLQAPDHPANFAPELGVAVNFTDVPVGKLATQVNPHLMPDGLLVIVPAPVPVLCKVSWAGGTVELNVAVADVACVRSTVHVDVPLQAPPDHPANAEPDFGVAVRVTDVPVVILAEQVAPQLIPEGLLVTVPAPVPVLCTTSRTGGSFKLNCAMTVALAFRVRVQPAERLQASNHAPNVELDSGVSVSVTTVPVGKSAVHVVGQLMPAGLLVIVPAPAPVTSTVSCTVVVGSVVAPAELALQYVPPMTRNNNRQHRLPKKNLDLDILPRGYPLCSMQSSGLRLSAGAEASEWPG